MVAPVRRKERAIVTAPDISRTQNGFLAAHHLTKRYGSVLAVEDVSLEISQGEFVCVLGPSGCGKTTLLRMIAGLEDVSEGNLFLGGREITRSLPAQRRCGVVFQSYALFPNLTAFQNVAYGLRKMPPPDRARRVRELLEWVDLSDCSDRRPSQLSGGQQQRVALARALAPEPSVLLLDEPLSALDAKVRHYLRQEIRNIQRRLGITTIMVTHDQIEAMTMAERVVVMRGGRVLQIGTPSDLYHRPADPFVADFLGSMNFATCRVKAKDSVDFLGHELRMTCPVPSSVGEEVTIAIRPEDVGLADTNGENRVEAEVTDREFRGSYYRIRVRVGGHTGGQYPVDLDIDLQGHTADSQEWRIGDRVTVQLPAERLLAFAGRRS